MYLTESTLEIVLKAVNIMEVYDCIIIEPSQLWQASMVVGYKSWNQSSPGILVITLNALAAGLQPRRTPPKAKWLQKLQLLSPTSSKKSLRSPLPPLFKGINWKPSLHFHQEYPKNASLAIHSLFPSAWYFWTLDPSHPYPTPSKPMNWALWKYCSIHQILHEFICFFA